jgi:hypothetical protein
MIRCSLFGFSFFFFYVCSFVTFRFKLNGIMMELSNAVEEDLRIALDVCEKEATKSSAMTAADLARAIQSGVYNTAATAVTPSVTGGGGGGPSTAAAAATAVMGTGLEGSNDEYDSNGRVSLLPQLTAPALPSGIMSTAAAVARAFDTSNRGGAAGEGGGGGAGDLSESSVLSLVGASSSISSTASAGIGGAAGGVGGVGGGDSQRSAPKSSLKQPTKPLTPAGATAAATLASQPSSAGSRRIVYDPSSSPSPSAFAAGGGGGAIQPANLAFGAAGAIVGVPMSLGYGRSAVAPLHHPAPGAGTTTTTTSDDIHYSTERNTVLNSITKHPHIVKLELANAAAAAAAAATNAAPPVAPRSPGAQQQQQTSTSIAGSGYHDADSHAQQLLQQNAHAAQYVQSFREAGMSRVARWCKYAVPEIRRSVALLYPAVRGPVELVKDVPPNSPKGSNDAAAVPAAPKRSPVLQSFRRRGNTRTAYGAGGGLLGASLPGSIQQKVRDATSHLFERVGSVGAAGMSPEWLTGSGVPPPSFGGDSGSFMGAPPVASLESVEETRRRALKFLLNDRETHYDLLQRDVVDAVTMQQMEHARAAAALRRQEAAMAECDAAVSDAANGGNGNSGSRGGGGSGGGYGSTREPEELRTHQYRQHHLLTDNYDDDGAEAANEAAYSFYVSLPEMSAQSALSTRQAVRVMQSTSANISYDTISKVG